MSISTPMDHEGKAAFIIERVFERGDVPDIRNCHRYYGDDKIREALTNAKWLPCKPYTWHVPYWIMN